MIEKTVNEVMGTRTPKAFNPKGVVACLNPNVLVGYELEIEGVDSWPGWRRWRDLGESPELNTLGFQITEDRSLRGQSAEFITKPMKMENALHSLNEFFRMTGYRDANYSDRCSVHVHASCNELTMGSVMTLALLYSVVEEPLFEFIGNYRDTNIYCVPWYQCRDHTKVMFNFLNDPAACRHWQKYTALNLLPLTTQGTVEFRHLHGTADVEKITRWSNMVGSLMHEATTRSFSEVEEELMQLNTTSQYQAFFERTLGNQIPYTPVMAEKLESGVIQAKYSLFSKDGKNDPPKVRFTVGENTLGVNAAAAGDALARGLANINRLQAEIRQQATRTARFTAAAPQPIDPIAGVNFPRWEDVVIQDEPEMAVRPLVAPPIRPAPRPTPRFVTRRDGQQVRAEFRDHPRQLGVRQMRDPDTGLWTNL